MIFDAIKISQRRKRPFSAINEQIKSGKAKKITCVEALRKVNAARRRDEKRPNEILSANCNNDAQNVSVGDQFVLPTDSPKIQIASVPEMDPCPVVVSLDECGVRNVELRKSELKTEASFWDQVEQEMEQDIEVITSCTVFNWK